MCQRNSIERGRGMETISVVIQNCRRVICVAMTFFNLQTYNCLHLLNLKNGI